MQQIGSGLVGAALTGVVKRSLILFVRSVDFNLFVFIDEKSDDIAEALGGGVVQSCGTVAIVKVRISLEFEQILARYLIAALVERWRETIDGREPHTHKS